MLLPTPSLAESATVLYLAQPVPGARTVVVVAAWIGVEAYAARGGIRQRDAVQDGGTKVLSHSSLGLHTTLPTMTFVA